LQPQIKACLAEHVTTGEHDTAVPAIGKVSFLKFALGLFTLGINGGGANPLTGDASDVYLFPANETHDEMD
jgi:hypothetical protein